jgi:hypothetical protein
MESKILGEWIEPTVKELLLKKSRDFLINEILFQNERAIRLEKELREANFNLTKTEKLVSGCYDLCLCERLTTKGFDYGETHSREGKPSTGSRFNTPRDIIESVIGFKWKYRDKEKPGHSWKELQFKIYDNKKDGFY